MTEVKAIICIFDRLQINSPINYMQVLAADRDPLQ
jgi:hypothetical protein